MYNLPYIIPDMTELSNLINMAEKHGALLIVSRTIEGAFLRSPGFTASIRSCISSGMTLATKLRNPMLFKDIYMLALGPHENAVYLDANHHFPKPLVVRAQNYHSRMLNLAQTTHMRILAHIAQMQLNGVSEMNTFMKEQLISCAAESLTFEAPFVVRLPLFFRKLHEARYKNGSRPFTCFTTEILRNNLWLNKHVEAGAGGYEDYFLGYEIGDDTLPWDTHEQEW